jgi:hypothetical protein
MRVRPTYDFDAVADYYVSVATRALNEQKSGRRALARAECYGVLRALEVLVGMDEACHLVERAAGRTKFAPSVDALLYSFWSIDRPAISPALDRIADVMEAADLS